MDKQLNKLHEQLVTLSEMYKVHGKTMLWSIWFKDADSTTMTMLNGFNNATEEDTMEFALNTSVYVREQLDRWPFE